jgi:lysophospholipase L1-like esterase
MRGILQGVGKLLPILASGAAPAYPSNPDDAKPVIALLGDSITQANTPTSNGDINRGYWHWAQAMSGFRAYCAAYAGVGGNITTQMLARLNTDVITPLSAPQYDGRTKYCIVMGGVNDSTNASDIVATATANLTSIYSALITAGITPIAMTITPTSSCDTSTKRANWNGINSWLISYCPAHGITLCNNISACLDQEFPATTTPVWKSGYTHDGVHTTAKGAQAIAAALATALTSLLPTVDHFQAATEFFYGSVLKNHAMIGTTGMLNSGITGEAARDWEAVGGAAATASKADRADGKAGEWQILTLPASVRLNALPSLDAASGFSVGNLIVAQAELFCPNDWEAITQLVLVVEFRNGASVLKTVSFLGNDPYTGGIPNPAPDATLVLRTVPTIVPANTNIMRTYIYFVGDAGTIKVGRYEVIRLAQ